MIAVIRAAATRRVRIHTGCSRTIRAGRRATVYGYSRVSYRIIAHRGRLIQLKRIEITIFTNSQTN